MVSGHSSADRDSELRQWAENEVFSPTLPIMLVPLGSLCTEGPLSAIPRSISSSNVGENPRLSATLGGRELRLEPPKLNALPETLGAMGRMGGGHWWEERVRVNCFSSSSSVVSPTFPCASFEMVSKNSAGRERVHTLVTTCIALETEGDS